MKTPYLQHVGQQVQQHAQQIADGAAGVSVAAAGYAWLETANAVGQLVATIIAIISGIAAAWWHIKRIRAANRAEKKRSEDG